MELNCEGLHHLMAALGAELRRMMRILGLPAALVALILGSVSGLGAAALSAELALIQSAA